MLRIIAIPLDLIFVYLHTSLGKRQLIKKVILSGETPLKLNWSVTLNSGNISERVEAVSLGFVAKERLWLTT